MKTTFVSQEIIPDPNSLDPAVAASGAPALPRQFTWQGRPVILEQVLSQWKTSSACRHGSGEQYVRRHWFEIRTADGATMTIYFERQPRSRKKSRRWWIYSTQSAQPPIQPHTLPP